MRDWLINTWYEPGKTCKLLLPFSGLFFLLSQCRRWFLCRFKQKKFPIPILVVGNLSVGGVGKTPLVIALAKQIQDKGFKVGIVSRGYKAKIKNFPYSVRAQDLAIDVGDEPLLIHKRTNCPVIISPKRSEAVEFLINKHQCQVIISDDGLQHYAMGRAIEIVVIDGQRQFGNGYCLPAGPLREPVSRLKEVDFIVINQGDRAGSYAMNLIAQSPINLAQENIQWQADNKDPIAAMAGIGNPKRFFDSLRNIGLNINEYFFPDHHLFTADELQFKEKIVLMTEKDAMKCKEFAQNNWFYMPIDAILPEKFWQDLWAHEFLKGYR